MTAIAVGAVDLTKSGGNHVFHGLAVLPQVIDEVNDGLCIGLGREGVTLGDKLLLDVRPRSR